MTIQIEVDDQLVNKLKELHPDMDTFGDRCFTAYHNSEEILGDLVIGKLLYSESGLYYYTDLGSMVARKGGFK